MCGRFVLVTSPELLAAIYELFNLPPLNSARYNIAPSSQVLGIRACESGREGVMLKWGLIPHWAKEPDIGVRMTNARSETAAQKPSFRSAFKSRRCLIPADGFYEWKKIKPGSSSGGKQPYYIYPTGDEPFAFAGLWESWQPENGEPIETCTILTTTPNELMRPIHDRMPVILNPADWDMWLDETNDNTENLTSILKPCDSLLMQAHPVSKNVNKPSFDVKECIEPVEVTEAEDQTSLFG